MATDPLTDHPPFFPIFSCFFWWGSSWSLLVSVDGLQYIYNDVHVFRQVLILIQTSPVAEGSSEQNFAMSLPTCPAPLTVVMAPVGEKNTLHHRLPLNPFITQFRTNKSAEDPSQQRQTQTVHVYFFKKYPKTSNLKLHVFQSLCSTVLYKVGKRVGWAAVLNRV